MVACDIAPGPLELAQEKAQAEGRTAHVPFLSIISIFPKLAINWPSNAFYTCVLGCQGPQ